MTSQADWRRGVSVKVNQNCVVGPHSGSAQGPMMSSRTAGGLARVAWTHRLQTLAPARRSPPQVGVVKATRSIATNREQVVSSTVVPACWYVMRAKPLRGHLLHQWKPPRRGEKGVGGGTLGPDTTGAATRDCTAAMRARASGSLFTNYRRGWPRNRGKRRRKRRRWRTAAIRSPDESENGDCQMVCAMSCGVSPGECWSPGCLAALKEPGSGARGWDLTGLWDLL